MDEVHVFRGEATVDENAMGYEPGSRHAVMVFSRQPAGSDHDFALAARRAEENDLREVSLESGGKVRLEAINAMPAEFAQAYGNALELGYAVIVYSEPIVE
jgi:hypothetical protein